MAKKVKPATPKRPAMVVRMPVSLRNAIKAAAREDGRSSTNWVVRLIQRELGKTGKGGN